MLPVSTLFVFLCILELVIKTKRKERFNMGKSSCTGFFSQKQTEGEEITSWMRGCYAQNYYEKIHCAFL
jgi:hypothetical protein